MYKTNDIVEMIKKKEIDPFDIISISKNDLLNYDIKYLNKLYKKKALVLHPDKTNGETELEFKILSTCYKYLLKVKEKYTSKYIEYSNNIFKQQYNEKHIINTNVDTDTYIKGMYDRDTNIHLDWGSKETRKKFLIDDDQEDETEFLESFQKRFPNSFFFSEIPTIKKSNTSIHDVIEVEEVICVLNVVLPATENIN
jgi:curved DNA-binding protein CbpA